MTIRINDRDVAAENAVDAVMEKPVTRIQFDIGESFTFSDAFDFMTKVAHALGLVEIHSYKEEDSSQTELDFSQGASIAGNEISGSEQSQPEIEGDVAVSLVEATLVPGENENAPTEETKGLEEAKAEAETKGLEEAKAEAETKAKKRTTR